MSYDLLLPMFISSPEIFVIKANVGKWQVLQHRFDLENKGPSPLVSGTMFKIYFPFVTINKNHNLYMNQSLDFSKDKCEFMSCQVQPIPELSSVSIALTFMMASEIFSTLKAGNDELKSVNIVSKVMVSLPSNQRLERDSLEIESSTGTKILPSKPIVEIFEWWEIPLCVLGGIAINVIIVIVAYKRNFFHREMKEQLKKKKLMLNYQNLSSEHQGTEDLDNGYETLSEQVEQHL
ncbi:hypothetical protein KUTeg_008894 [Tegillarca granosa]|uniref:Integrin alpha-2 domain-containing protein n=1 Tax=Tegillarca granosa TaxID=220873 RepID=A0ABQ9FAH0_TEGGR|nr:hypothetical protein KUTeg_008894 [Tegillarca granosa]